MDEPQFITIPLAEYQQLIAIAQEISTLREQIDYLQEKYARDIAEDRRRITALEKIEPQPMQRDRGEILKALLAANSGKMLAKDARKKMHLSKSRFSELVATMKDEIDSKPYHLNKNWRVLSLR